MADLIDREALKARLHGWMADCQEDGDASAVGHFEDCISLVDTQPAVDAAPVVHGQWIEASVNTEGFFAERQHKCSVCNGVTPYGNHGGYWYWRYCPHCGARMGKECD